MANSGGGFLAFFSQFSRKNAKNVQKMAIFGVKMGEFREC